MTRYRLEYEPAARKQLRAVTDRRLKAAFEVALSDLTSDPRPQGCEKLPGFKHHWRIRVGTWRIVYRIEEGRLVVMVVTIAPRGGVYR